MADELLYLTAACCFAPPFLDLFASLAAVTVDDVVLVFFMSHVEPLEEFDDFTAATLLLGATFTSA